MFGVSKKIFKKTVEDVVDIVGIHHDNVSTLQEALVHLGDAVQSMNELIQVQEARIELLEKQLKGEKDESKTRV